MKISQKIIIATATFFYVGFLPLIPGTFGSIAGIILYFFVKNNIYVFMVSLALVIILGLVFSGRAERIFQKKDASFIVIDEVAGMLLSLMFLPFDIKLVALAFLIFRALDTLKPFPAGALQELRGSLGIMSDDIIAGLYTNIILQVALRLVCFKAS